MQRVSLLNSYPDWLERFLNFLEITFWQEQFQIDSQSPTFYVYKPYPSSISNKQLDSWIKLQERALSPYKDGSSFSIPLKKGVAIWASKGEFKGTPETAMQRSLEDGTWYVKGKTLSYRQVWKGKVMQFCETVPSSATSAQEVSITESSVINSWAKPRQVDGFLKSPMFGFCVSGVIASLLLLWFSTAFIVQSVEVASLNSKFRALENSVGDTLSARETQQINAEQIDQIRSWKNELGHLPVTFARVVSIFREQSPWIAGKVRWQNKTLTITVFAEELDITKLVQNLEGTGTFENVSIRPKDNANLWTLEVVVRD